MQIKKETISHILNGFLSSYVSLPLKIRNFKLLFRYLLNIFFLFICNWTEHLIFYANFLVDKTWSEIFIFGGTEYARAYWPSGCNLH